jgi:hypothetical protein
MTAKQAIEKLLAGETIVYSEGGNSMTPKIKSREPIILAPIPPDHVFKRGQIVLCRVGKYHYTHLISAVSKDRVQISNNHGHVNGWTPKSRVYGIYIGTA